MTKMPGFIENCTLWTAEVSVATVHVTDETIRVYQVGMQPEARNWDTTQRNVEWMMDNHIQLHMKPGERVFEFRVSYQLKA